MGKIFGNSIVTGSDDHRIDKMYSDLITNNSRGFIDIRQFKFLKARSVSFDQIKDAFMYRLDNISNFFEQRGIIFSPQLQSLVQ